MDKIRNTYVWDEVMADIRQKGFASASVDVIKRLADAAIRKRFSVE